MAWPRPETTNSHWSAPRWRLLAPPSRPPGGSTIWAAWLRALPIETRKPRPNRKLSRRIAMISCLPSGPATGATLAGRLQCGAGSQALTSLPPIFAPGEPGRPAGLRSRAPCRSPWLKVRAGKKVSLTRRNCQSTGNAPLGRWPLPRPGSGGAIGDLDDEHGAKLRVAQANDAAVRGDELVRHRQAEAGAALAGRALEGLEQVGARLLWHARPVVADLDGDARALALCRNLDPTPDRLAQLDCLQGIATEVAQDAEQLIAVGIDPELGFHRNRPIDGTLAWQTKTVGHFRNQRRQAHQFATGRRFFGAAKF